MAINCTGFQQADNHTAAHVTRTADKNATAMHGRTGAARRQPVSSAVMMTALSVCWFHSVKAPGITSTPKPAGRTS